MFIELDHAQANLAIVDQQLCADGQSGEDFRMQQRRARGIAECIVLIEHEFGAHFEGGPLVLETTDPQLGTLQIGENADGPATFLFHFPDEAVRTLVIFVRTVAEVEPEHIDTCIVQAADGVLVIARRPQRGDDLGVSSALHDDVLYLFCSETTRIGVRNQSAILTQ